MKKLLIILLILSLFLPVIEAKVVNITKTDFYIESRQAYRLEKGDGISFIKDDKEYVISVDEIGKNGVRLKSFAYKDSGERETFYLILNQNYSNKIDFEKDDIYDMQLNFLKTWNVDNATKVDILFEALNETKTNSELKTGLIITSLIIIIGLITYFILKKK